MKMSYELRQLLLDKSVKNLIKEIDKKLIINPSFDLYLSAVSSCLSDAYADQNLHNQNPKAYQNAIDDCYQNNETIFLDSLTKQNIISCDYTLEDDGTFFIAKIKALNIALVKSIIRWVKQERFIIHFGIFSLNTFTGEAYCLDNKYLFKPGTGYYDLFKEFLVRKKHFVSFEEICLIQQQTFKDPNDRLSKSTFLPNEKKNNELADLANQKIKYLKKKLNMKSGIGKLFSKYEKRGFILLIEPH